MSGLEDLLALPELSPGPSGEPLEVTVRCYADPSHKRWSSHALVLQPDWSAQVPHDLDGERVLAALGGYCSCLALVERVLPAVREYLRRQLRHALPRLSRSRNSAWRLPDPVATCCAWGATYRSAQEAAEHARSPRHVAAEHGARTTTVQSVGAAVLRAHGVADPLPLPRHAVRELSPCLLDPTGAAALWQAGLPPALVQAVHQRVAVGGRPLPTGFYLGALTARPDLRWIAETAASAPERELHEWLAWSESAADRREPDRRAGWLAAGVSRRDMPVLDEAGYAPADVRGLAAGIGRTGGAAGALLARWVGAGCTPAVGDLLRLHALAAPAYEQVNAAALDRLADEPEVAALGLDRAALAIALAVCGSAARAAVALAAMGNADAERLTQWSQEQDARGSRPARRRAGVSASA